MKVRVDHIPSSVRLNRDDRLIPHCGESERLWVEGRSRRWANISRVALKKLAMLDAADRLDDLRLPPGNRLEALKADRAGQYSIRVNDQWRICFRWQSGQAHEVEIVDYH